MERFININSDYIYSVKNNIIFNKEVKELIVKNNTYYNVKQNEISPTISLLQSSVKKIRNIIFEVTENCNLKCKYCIFGGDYKYQKKLNPKTSLTPEIARKTLEYFYKLFSNREDKNLVISFYGGEPLINFDIIIEIVNFAKKLFVGWNLFYKMTTNGTLINENNADFLIRNNFILNISLDGPKENHDSKRIYKKQKGTFDDIIKNLEFLKKKNIEYYKKNIFFASVFSKDLSLNDFLSFFKKDTFENKLNSINFVNPKNTLYYEKNPYNSTAFAKDFYKITDDIIEKIKDKKELKRVELLIKKKISNLNTLFYDKYTMLANSCLFNSKVFIDCKGQFHICEQITNNMSIGNFLNGFDFKKMTEIVTSFVAINKVFCSKCNIRYLCNRCYPYFLKNKHFAIDAEFCKKQKKRIPELLQNYVKIKEAENASNVNKSNILHKTVFNQFIMLEKGPVNTAIFDFFKGNVYQVDNQTIDSFKNEEYENINAFLKDATHEKLIIKVKNRTWVPSIEESQPGNLFMKYENVLHLEIEEGANIQLIKKFFNGYDDLFIIYFGKNNIDSLFPNTKIIYSKRTFNDCNALSKIDGNFSSDKDLKSKYFLNKTFNSCWRKKLGITKNNLIKPCIFSKIIIGSLENDNIHTIMKDANEYWCITKDKVKICKNCELRYICFDCREIAYRNSNKDLYAKNPNCSYNPNTGKWN